MYCLNDNKRTYTGKEPSPKGFGYCAHSEKTGKMMQGKDGKVWIVKKYGKTKKWVLSKFYKDYKKSENKLIKLLKKSIIKFKVKTIEDILKKDKNWFKDQQNIKDIYFPEISIEFKLDKIGEILGPLEFQRCAYKSDFFKYVMNSGSDYGPISKGKIPNRTFYYEISSDFKLWKNFKKENAKFNKKSKETAKYILENEMKLSKKYINYIKKVYI